MEKIIWTDALGNSIDLATKTDISQIQGKAGHLMPTFNFTVANMQPMEGSIITNVGVNARTISIPVHIAGENYYDVLQKLNALCQTFNPALGDGYLTFYEYLTGKKIYCRYTGGLEGADANNFLKSQVAVLSFRADDPYWYDVAATSVTKTQGDPSGTFFPFFPLELTQGATFADFYIDNTGSADVYPIWTFKNAGTNLYLTNITTGKTFAVIGSWIDGENLIIDTRQKYKTVKKDTVNFWPYVSLLPGEHDMWPLIPGLNHISAVMINTSSMTQVQIDYTLRYLSL